MTKDKGPTTEPHLVQFVQALAVTTAALTHVMGDKERYDE